MNDLLYVSYDHNGEDEPGLCVGRPNNDGSHSILKILAGERAEDMYRTLTNQRRGTNLDVIRVMSADELAEFIEDLAEFDNPNHEWRCKLCPALPFETWRDWLERRANIHE